MIGKLANIGNNYYRSMKYYENARAAFKAYMQSLCFAENEYVLLPAFIGWSAREGSGVFDPVKSLGIKYAFCAVDKDLNIDLDSLEKVFKSKKIKLFVIIHYFGFVDPNYEAVISLAREHGIKILEDEAHALYTDLIGGISGRLGDACIFSLHKMLPVKNGGILCVNCREESQFEKENGGQFIKSPFCYDLVEIAKKRLQNSEILSNLLRDKTDKVLPLRGNIKNGEIPQTFPVIINGVSRDKLYERMNNSGFGVVSLYHTMIEQISSEEFPESYFISKRIMNLPVHQDAEPHELKIMVDTLFSHISDLEEVTGQNE